MNSEAEAPWQPNLAPRGRLPDFLAGRVNAEQYAKCLESSRRRRMSAAIAIGVISGPDWTAYKDAINAAVVESQGRDAYTGEELRWELLCAYKDESEAGRSTYKAQFALLPLDHATRARTPRHSRSAPGAPMTPRTTSRMARSSSFANDLSGTWATR